ncbi:hypothetical protein GQR58_023769 [Nymphon striatum]|nr:hypothetical protein GQR58_023769 [Nymphon striatum]
MYRAFQPNASSKIWEPGAHKKEVKFSLDARKTLHTTHISKSIGIISADNNAECTHLQCVPSIPTLRMGTFYVVVGRNYSNRLRNVCCVQGFLGIQREFQFLFVRLRAPKFFEDAFSLHPTRISVPFCVPRAPKFFEDALG